MNDIALAFDPTGFLSGIKAIENQLVSLNSNFQKTGDTGQKKNQQIQLSAMNLMGVFAKMGAVVGVFKMALNGIPEIGQTFKIAGDIFQRNLLWPLRQELVPILQKVLDWVRDNRAMFVRWGTVIANAFRAVFSIIKMIVKMGKDLFDQLMRGLEQIFGKSVKSVTEMANIILFKITAVAMFIMMALEPVFKWLVDSIVKVIGYVKNFVEGFMNGFGSITPIIKQFAGLWDRVVKLFDRLLPAQSKANSFFKILGSILGTVVLGAILGIITALDMMITGIEKAINRIQYFNAWRKENHAEMNRLNRENKNIDKDFKTRSRQNLQLMSDSIGRTKELMFSPPKGQINNTNTNSNKTTVNNDNKTVHIKIDGSKDPVKTAETLDQKLRESRFQSGGK